MSLAENLYEDRRDFPFILPSEERRLQAELRGMGPSLVSVSSVPVNVEQHIETGLRQLARSLKFNVKPGPAKREAVHPVAVAVEKTRISSADAGAARFAPRRIRPADTTIDAADDVPAFLRQAAETPQPAPRERGSLHHPDLPRSLDPTPMSLPAPVRLQAPRAARRTPSMVSLFLAYSVFFLIPLTAWVSDMVDPRIAAAAPAIYFTGWLSIHGWRGDQLSQLRILAAWQLFQMASSLSAMRPGSGIPHGGIYWSAAVTAACASLFVVAVSAIVEASEFRVRTAPKPMAPAAVARRPRANS